MTAIAPDVAGVTIREATRADLLSVFRIERASFPQPWPYEAFERFLGANGFLVADVGGNPPLLGGPAPPDGIEGAGPPDGVVGYVVANRVPNHGAPFGHVKDLAVHPERRGDGIGRALLARAVAVLERDGVIQVKLEVRASNDRARKLYEELGFVHRRTVPGYYDNGEDALVLIR